MTPSTYFFKDVSLLITHYNRSHSLQNLLESLIGLSCSFEQIVVSDDGSQPQHLQKLEELSHQYGFLLVKAPVNKGLGHNINKGQNAIKTELTLYVQEDFVPTPLFPSKFQVALQLLHARPDIDMVRFYAYFEYPYLTPIRDGYYEMKFNIWKPGFRKFYVYSDHPHLRRSNFLKKFGSYREGIKGDNTEYGMMMSFLKNQGKALYYKGYTQLFEQRNSMHEPSTMHRNILRESNNYFIRNCRYLYRHIKFNYDYYFKPNPVRSPSREGSKDDSLGSGV
ncbi:glycosyltransferase involved in cell wall biosynthesis [Dyadobacter jejuensis]|uniref:Glycosyltransferase involved in cell wall biosynthesis n=1 Tax=Dyadobacter jejuensis TaxID=1082580 RepID=A0A316AIT4_9BACT|nr:glycosyltransferase family A protein [Dyadobacter jejuensis]PWJ56790.1 glycosyltransferase involved in cell wall biosynthesis [Dyadobacter jejuensis]